MKSVIIKFLPGNGISGLSLLNKNIKLLYSDLGELRQATSDDDGSLLTKKPPSALKPIVAPLSHCMRPHLYVKIV